MLAQQEQLKRKLSAVKATFEASDVDNYIKTIVVPLLHSTGINRFGLFLYSRDQQVLTFDLYADYILPPQRYTNLIECSRELGSDSFTLDTDSTILSGYSENGWDWIVLQYEKSSEEFFQPLIVEFWQPFFDYA